MAKIFRSSVINSSIDDVWAKIRDYNSLPKWHPAFVDSHIESDEPSDKIGCIRNFNLKDGGNIRERLLSLSDAEHSFTYTIVESSLPVEEYIATLRLFPITDGNRTYIEWVAEFNCSAEEEQNMSTLIGNDVFQGGINALKNAFEG